MPKDIVKRDNELTASHQKKFCVKYLVFFSFTFTSQCFENVRITAQYQI